MNNQLAKTAQTMLKNISYADMRELMIKNRFTCDSHWMMPMVMNTGWEVANKVNQDVSTSVGHVEMRRLMKALNLSKPSNEEEFMILLSLAMEAFLPKGYFDYILTKSNSGRNMAVVDQCYSNTKLRSINAEKEYQCGCFGLRAGWFQAMNVEVKEELVKCLKDGDARCEIEITSIDFF